MPLDWTDLTVFAAVARTGSFRRAAEKLKVNHATVHRAIGRLEAQLATRLFERSAHGVTLCHAGELMLPHVEIMEQQSFDITRKLEGVDTRPSGRVRVSLAPAMAQGFIMPILARFCDAYPEIEIELVISNGFSDLNRQEADISIRVARQVSDDVVGRRLLQYVKAVYASPAYLAQIGDLVPGDGAGATWIGWGTEDEPDWVKTSPFPNAGIRHRFPEALSQLEAAAQGLGLTWMGCFLGDADDRLVRVPGIVPQPDRSIWLLLHRDLRDTARVRAFVDFVADDISKNRRLFQS